jgi:osmotically-inducible protein OsmY
MPWRAVLALIAISICLTAAVAPANADNGSRLMHRVQAALAQNDNLNGAHCYTASGGTIILYGTVFDKKDRALAESVARGVPGVHQVVNTLRTSTGDWSEEEARINDTLSLNGFTGVQAKVIGNQVFVSGQVTSEAEEQRALRVVTSDSKLQPVNFMRVVPGSIF